MKTRIISLFLMLAAIAAQAGEAVYEPKNVAINIGKEVTADQVKQAFMAAPGEINGWAFEEKEAGKLHGTLHVRKHTVEVDIPYSAKEYSILYVKSENMKYDAEKKTIHSKYETWIKNLERVLIKNLTGPVAPAAPAAVPAVAPAAAPAK
jgi:polysaccharide deacetylase 2 family uncharacterized protein YibQ